MSKFCKIHLIDSFSSSYRDIILRKLCHQKNLTSSKYVSFQKICPYATLLPSVCHPFAIRLLSVCYPYFNPILLIFLCYHSFIDPFHLFRLEKNDKNVFFAVTQNTLRLLGISCVSTSLLPYIIYGRHQKGI